MYDSYHKYIDRMLHYYNHYLEKWLQFYSKFQHIEFIYYIPFVLFSLNVRLRYFFYLKRPDVGFPIAEDSQWYLDYARNLMTNFTIGVHMDDILYFGYNILLTLLLAIFKDPIAIIFIQAVTASVAVILVYKIALMLFNRWTAIIASFFYCYYAWGITLWAMYILSDSFFITLLLLCIYWLLLHMETKKKVYKISFIALSLFLIVFRPTGIISVAFIYLYILINMHRTTITQFFVKHRLALGGAFIAVVAAFLYLYLGSKLDPLIESMQFNAKKVLYNIYAKGWIYDRASAHDHFYRPNYNIDIMNSLIISFIVNNWDHISIIYGRRIIAFLGRWVWETDVSTLHGIKRLILQLRPTGLFLAGTVAMFYHRKFRKTSIVWLMILVALIFCIIFFIDGLYRYKAPAVPFIAIACAYGVEQLFQAALFFAKSCVGMLKQLWKKKRYSL